VVHRENIRSIAQAGLLAAAIVSVFELSSLGGSLAVVTGSFEHTSDVRFVDDSETAMSPAVVAKMVLTFLCQVKNPAFTEIPPDIRLQQLEKTLTAESAAKTLDVISRAAKTTAPLCPENGASPDSAVHTIEQLGRQLPGTPPDEPLQGVVSPIELDNARSVIQDIGRLLKAGAQEK
jgi:hypothetical protein